MSAKKLINDPEKVVDEALEALIRTNPSVQGIENHRVIVRSDLNNVQDKVAMICGGGSGHEVLSSLKKMFPKMIFIT